LERELVVDTYRLAVLPIVYLAEQQDPFGLSRQEAALDEGYRDVFQAGAWLYALHSYCLLVRGYLGGKTADAVREHQELLLSGGFSDKKDEISGAIELISQASAGQSDSMPETAVSAAISVEWNVALNLLRGLPDSPDFQSQSAEAVTNGNAGLPAHIHWQFAHCLLRSRQQIVSTFLNTLASVGSTLQ
jgi:hypothetical protein